MYSIRLTLTTTLMLLFAVVAPAQNGTSKPERESSAAAVPAAPEDGGPRDWEVIGVARVLNLREQPSTTARIVATFAHGSIGHTLLGAEGGNGNRRRLLE